MPTRVVPGPDGKLARLQKEFPEQGREALERELEAQGGHLAKTMAALKTARASNPRTAGVKRSTQSNAGARDVMKQFVADAKLTARSSPRGGTSSSASSSSVARAAVGATSSSAGAAVSSVLGLLRSPSGARVLPPPQDGEEVQSQPAASSTGGLSRADELTGPTRAQLEIAQLQRQIADLRRQLEEKDRITDELKARLLASAVGTTSFDGVASPPQGASAEAADAAAAAEALSAKLCEKVGEIVERLGLQLMLPSSWTAPQAVTMANAQLGLRAQGSLDQQVETLGIEMAASLKAPAPLAAASAELRAKRLTGVDPRWDVSAFEAWLVHCPCVTVGFLRDSAPSSRAEVPEKEWVRRLPKVDGPSPFACLSAAFALPRSRWAAAAERLALLEVLRRKGVEDNDLVWWDALAMESNEHRAEAFRVFTSYKMQVVVLPKCACPNRTGPPCTS